jgi:hypothetical protein
MTKEEFREQFCNPGNLEEWRQFTDALDTLLADAEADAARLYEALFEIRAQRALEAHLKRWKPPKSRKAWFTK